MLERGTREAGRESEQRHGIPTVFVISSPKVNGCCYLRGGFWYSNETGFVIIRSKVGTMVKDEHDGFWCIMIECLWGNTKFSLRIKNYPRGQVQKNCPPSRVDIIIQHSLMARRCLETILIEKIFVDDAVITIKADFQSPSLSLSRFSLNYYRILKSFPLWKDFGKLGVFPRRAIILLSPRAK